MAKIDCFSSVSKEADIKEEKPLDYLNKVNGLCHDIMINMTRFILSCNTDDLVEAKAIVDLVSELNDKESDLFIKIVKRNKGIEAD